MNILLFTAPGYVEHEHEIIEAMFRLGLKRLHLRKPNWTEKEIQNWLEKLDPSYLHRVVLHKPLSDSPQGERDYAELWKYYQVGGIHLNSRFPKATPEMISMQQKGQITISRSCHSLAELAEAKQQCDYLTLSPIFNSISKEGYQAAFTTEELNAAASCGLIDEKVYALGGISSDEIEQIRQWHFGGAALLGSVWQSVDPLAAIQQLL